jgi:hypothetical protein
MSSGDADGWRRPAAPDFQFEFYGVDEATTIWRSDPVVIGSSQDINGVLVGPPESTISVSRNDIRLRPQLSIDTQAGSGTRRKFFAELHSLHIISDGLEILAGEPFLDHLRDDLELSDEDINKVFRRSFGEIVSWNLTGDPTQDFPADNFFNVFFALKVFATDDYPAFTVFNKIPMLVVDLGIVEIPPLNRVTIPQFPYNLTELYFVRNPFGGGGEIGMDRAVTANCCKHLVNIEDEAPQGAMDYGAILEASLNGAESNGAGIALTTGAVANPETYAGPVTPPAGVQAGTFTPINHNPHIDGIFIPSGTTQITRGGTAVQFPTQPASANSEAVRNAVSSVEVNGKVNQINITPTHNLYPYQPPQLVGIGMGSNAGITFDLAALRAANPDLYLTEFVAYEGMSAESPVGSSVRLRVFVDGVEVIFADNSFTSPGESKPIRIELQRAVNTLTLVSIPTGNTPTNGNGVFALAEFRGFGPAAVGTYLQYWKDPNYRAA